MTLNEIRLAILAALSLVLAGDMNAGTLYSLTNDAGIRQFTSSGALDVIDLDAATSSVGGAGSSPTLNNRVFVFVFQLPDLGTVANPFTSAAFSFNKSAEVNNPKAADLYGLARRGSPDVLTNDFYLGPSPDPSPEAFLIATSVWPAGGGTIPEVVTLSESALVGFLNVQYAAGAGVGQYVFLRLNNQSDAAGAHRVTVTTGNGGSAGPPDTRPQINYTTIPLGPPVDTVRVETLADGTGTVQPATTIEAGTSLTNYAIARDGGGTFVQNTPANWVLTNVTGSIFSGDLVSSADDKSAIFTPSGAGSAQILAVGNATNWVPSGVITVTAPPDPFARPCIWVRDSEKSAILSKISGSSWAQSVYNGIVSRAAAKLASHQSDRDSYLRGMPINWSASPPRFNTGSSSYGSGEGFFNTALDCAVLFYLTGNTNYAQCAADILHNSVQAFQDLAPSTSVGNGGWLIPSDLLYEARQVGAQLPVVYDFLHPYLQAHQVYDVAAGGLVNFDFADAQYVFRTYYELVRDHGSANNNWSALMSTCMLNSILALENATERAAALQVFLTTGSSRQASLDYDYRYYVEPGDIWPESLQYASGVGEIRSFQMVLLERYDSNLQLFDAYPNLPLSLSRISYLQYPNGEQISFGDGHRHTGGQPFFDYELTYAHASARGRLHLTALYGSLINGGVADGDYVRSALKSYSSLGRHNEPLQLLWLVPSIPEPPAPLELPRADTLPFAGIALQRNPAPANNTDHGLMCFVGGAAFVHNHASGMSMEIYGMGQVMGAKSGRTTYGETINERHYRVFAANNTIIVNGASRGEGGWKGLGMNTVQTVAMEPEPFVSAVSPNLSFTCSSFADNKGTLAEATQQRTLAIVRTSPTSGYYVDLFRSKSTVSNRVATTLYGDVTNQFHDYIYRNIGETTVDIKANGANGVSLPLLSQPNRFQNDIGDTIQQPGWRYFDNTVVSYPHSAPVWAQFMADPAGPPIYMDLHMPAVATREVAKVDSPAIVDAPSPYDNDPSPTLVIRQIGEAWDKPFAAIYEPHYSVNGGTVQNVIPLQTDGVVVGMKVESLIGGQPLVQYVISNPDATDTYAEPALGLSFTGRLAVITDHGDSSGELYLGEGSTLAYRGYSVASVGGTNTQASVVFAAGQAPDVTANAPVTVGVAGAPAFTQIVRQTGGSISMTATGSLGVPFTLWASTDLAPSAWTEITNGTVNASPLILQDTGATNLSSRFYRFSTP